LSGAAVRHRAGHDGGEREHIMKAASSRTSNRVPASDRAGPRPPTEIDTMVGANVRNIRLQRALTLLELGGTLQVSQQQMHKYEMGINRLSAGMIYQISYVLEVPIESLFDPIEDPNHACPDPEAAEVLALKKECRFWLKRLQSERVLRRAAAILRVLALD